MREVLPLLPRLLLVEILTFAALLLLVVTVVGIPLAVKKAVDWSLAGQEIVFRGGTARAALGASTQLVRGRWWRVAVVILALFVVGALVGPLVGAALIMLTDASLWTINIVGLLVFGLTLPYLVTTLTLLYLEPRTQTEASRGAWSRLLAGRTRRNRPAAARADA